MKKNTKKPEAILINKAFFEEYMWLIKKNKNAGTILLFISQYMDNYNCFHCTHSTLMSTLLISRETIRLAIKLLRDNGFIHTLKTPSYTTYIVNPNFIRTLESKKKSLNSYPSFENLNTLRTREDIKAPDFTML